MAPRLLRDGSWYDPISSRSVYESEYEQSILRYSADLFPGYVCVPFKATVQSDIGNVQADLVLVDRDYRGWTIVEVELEHHPLWGHVEPQMRKLIEGRYTEAHASTIALASEDLDEERMRRLVTNVTPEFMVIAPVEAPDWRPTLRNMGVGLAMVQLFVNPQNQRVLLYEGDRPTARPTDLVTRLAMPSGFLPRAMRAESPAALPEQGELSLEFEGFVTTWRVLRTQRETILMPNGTLDLDPHARYRIVRGSTYELTLERER